MSEFIPSFCPYPACRQHAQAEKHFFVRHGTFVAACRSEPVPRFRCRSCRRTFSSQTFRQDYRDRRPELNVRVFEHLASGIGFRQCARLLRMGVGALQQKAHKIARHMALLHDNLSSRLAVGDAFVLDEEETFEAAAIRRVDIAMLVEQKNWFVVASAVGTLRRLAKPGTARRRWQDREELQHGKRPDESSRCVRAVLESLRVKVGDRPIRLISDLKASYGRIAKQVFGGLVRHERTSGKDPRTPQNPLFPINTMQAMGRDLIGALRPRSWLHAKKAAKLPARLAIFVVYRNYQRKRFNTDKEDKSPAVHLDLIPRSLKPEEAQRWRQDFGLASIHPLSHDGRRRIGAPEATSA